MNTEETKINKEESKPDPSTKKQEQSDPQLTELRGFIDGEEDIEPTLTDGRKSPDKAGDAEKK